MSSASKAPRFAHKLQHANTTTTHYFTVLSKPPLLNTDSSTDYTTQTTHHGRPRTIRELERVSFAPLCDGAGS
jgi:hypothetical protein